MIDIKILEKLNAGTKNKRLDALKHEVEKTDFPTPDPRYINNHIHTTYSFSPYSPAAAIYAARVEGLATAGIVDHDSVSGAKEFIKAGEIAGIPVTVGMECRVSMNNTPLEGKRTNNPDQAGISYMTLQGIPHNMLDTVEQFLSPLRKVRHLRNELMVKRINELIPKELSLNYQTDVIPLSMAKEGGGVTERHLMLAAAKKIIAFAGRGDGTIRLLENLGINLSSSQNQLLSDTSYYFYEYDLLGILKSTFVPKIYIPADEECPLLSDMVNLAVKTGAFLCYAYLGDVENSVTGDKAAQKFEDDYLELLIKCLHDSGVNAITYMPTRNSEKQLTRLRALCSEYKMLEVSGEDINSPRQSFIIRKMEDPVFKNLIDSTWMLIENERKHSV